MTFPVMPHVVSWPTGPSSISKLAATSNWPSGKRTESAVKNSESGGRSTPKRCVKNSEIESCSVVSDSLRPHGLYCPWTVPGQSTEVGSLSLLQGIFPTQGRSPTLQADSLPTEPPGKSENTGVGSLSPLQGIFPTQELNPRLLHCRGILYQLSYQGSPSNL